MLSGRWRVLTGLSGQVVDRAAHWVSGLQAAAGWRHGHTGMARHVRADFIDQLMVAILD